MNIMELGAIGEVLGAVAVIGTLIYLARQIRQSVGIARASQNRALIESFEGINDVVLSNTHLVDALKAVENPERGKDRPDSVLLRHLVYRWMNVWFSAEVSYANRQISAMEFAIYKDDFVNILELYPGLVPTIVDELRRYPSTTNYEVFAPIAEQL